MVSSPHPKGFKEAYQAFIANGWNGVAFPTEYGGQGLPWQLSTAHLGMLEWLRIWHLRFAHFLRKAQ